MSKYRLSRVLLRLEEGSDEREKLFAGLPGMTEDEAGKIADRLELALADLVVVLGSGELESRVDAIGEYAG
jgi:hypothetical protein